MRSSYKRYTTEDDALLQRVWSLPVQEIHKYFPDRSYMSLKHRAKFLNIQKGFNASQTKQISIPEIQIGYFAGHFDGEGCVQMIISKTRQNNFRVGVRISSTGCCLNVIQKYQHYFDGVVKTSKGVNKPLHRWVICSFGECANFLHIICPHLIEKQSQAKLALEWIEWRLKQPKHHLFSESEISAAHEICQQIKRLKTISIAQSSESLEFQYSSRVQD